MREAPLAFLISVLLCTVVWGQNATYEPDPKWSPPANAVKRANPLANKPQAAAGGRKLFLRECAQCHAEDGGGISTAADLQLAVVQDQTDGALFWKITTGNPGRGMPSWSRLPETQRWQLVLFLRTLATRTAK